MAEPITITIGMLIASAFSIGSEAMVKTAVGETVKDAYRALKAKLSIWAAGEAQELEKTPSSKGRQAVIAEIVDGLPLADRDSLRVLADALTARLKEQAPALGLDVGRLEAVKVELGRIVVTRGVGVRISEAKVADTFRADNIEVGDPPGKH